MMHQSLSLIEILSPPGNRWLMELSRRKTELPAGVRIVRFNGDDDGTDDEEAVGAEGKRRKAVAAGSAQARPRSGARAADTAV